jgi:hypothetical protein
MIIRFFMERLFSPEAIRSCRHRHPSFSHAYRVAVTEHIASGEEGRESMFFGLQDRIASGEQERRLKKL